MDGRCCRHGAMSWQVQLQLRVVMATILSRVLIHCWVVLECVARLPDALLVQTWPNPLRHSPSCPARSSVARNAIPEDWEWWKSWKHPQNPLRSESLLVENFSPERVCTFWTNGIIFCFFDVVHTVYLFGGDEQNHARLVVKIDTSLLPKDCRAGWWRKPCFSKGNKTLQHKYLSITI